MKKIFLTLLVLLFIGTNSFCGTPGTLKWSIRPETTNIPSVAIGKNGTIYAAGGTRLKAINPDNGSIIWSFSTTGVVFHSSPVVLADGSICVAGSDSTLYVVRPDGNLRWSKPDVVAFDCEIATNSDGTIFSVILNKLYCFSIDGDIIWTYEATDNFNSPPVIGMDGSIYVSASTPRTLYAINPDGTLKWKQQYPWAAGNSYDDPAVLGIPVIGINGRVYVGDSRGYLREIDAATGTLLYEFWGIDRASMTYQPVILADGRILIGCANAAIYRFNAGSNTGVSFMPQGAVTSTPAIGADGTIYFGVSYQVTYHTYYFYAVSSGNMGEKWKYYVGHQMSSSPAIAKDGTAYIGTTDGYLYAIYVENTDYQKNSPFPKYRHDNYNTGNSVYNTYIKCQPAVYNFGNVILGAKSYKRFAITNISNTPFTLGAITISGGDNISGEFSLTENCSGESILQGQTLYLTVCFMPLLNGKRSASVRIPFGDKMAIIGLFGTGGGDGQSALITTVYDGSNGNALEGAQVKVGSQIIITDYAGQCVFSPIAPGSYDIEVNKDGYSSVIKPVEVPASSNVSKNIIIYPSNFVMPIVTDISSKYDGTVFYLDGVDFDVEFTINIDWAGHTPGKVKFITPRKIIEQSVSTSSAKQTFNMGTDFGIGGTLKVQAITSTGGLSEEKEADFVVMKPLPVFTMAPIDKGPYFSYESKLGANWNFFNEGLDGSGIPSDIPLFGGKPVWLKCIPTVSAEVSSAGEASIGLEFEGLQKEKKIDSGKIAGLSFSLYPIVNIDGQYYPSEHDWDWAGYAGLHGKVELKKSWPFVVMVGPVPIPMYAKASVSLEAEALLGVTSLEPIGMNGKISINPYVRGSLGAGVDEILAVEGWIGGGLELGLQFPEEPTLDELSIYLNAGFTVYALLFTWENEALHWEYSLIDKKIVSSQIPCLSVETPQPAKRDYIKSPDYGIFKGGIDSIKSGSETKVTTLQQNVFPHSEPAIGCAGQYLYAAWLYDDPARSSLNRTKLVFSSFDGTRWSTPVAVYDDGTADFHPELIVFQDGWAAVVWENVKIQLPDNADFEQMKQNLEICVSFYNPQTGTWSVPYSITNNDYLDRSPKISGPDKNSMMVIWISNQSNHITGNTQNPNTIYSTIWNGTSWETPEVVINTDNYPNFKKPLIGYDFVYNRKYSPTNFFAVAYFCFDMDEDLSTINDRDIFSTEWHRQAFGGWRKTGIWDRTDDNLPDGNVRVFFSNDSLQLYFLKNNMVYLTDGYLSFGTIGIFYTFEDEYSSNISGFKIARSPSGKLAFVWTEPSGFSSDLFAVFYDPVSKKFGKPQQLTSDSQTEHSPVVTFYGEDKLVSIYDRVEIEILQDKFELACGKNVSMPTVKTGTTDLAFFMHTLTDDISFETDSFYITPFNPSCGSTAEIYITLENTGNTVLKNIPVCFYTGDPQNGGTLIGSTTIASYLAPGEKTLVSMEWEVPEVTEPISIYAVIDPDGTLPKENKSNNTAVIECVFPDIEATYIGRTIVSENLTSISAIIQNIGVLSTGNFVLQIRKDGLNGTIIHERTVDNLEPNEILQINFLWNSGNVSDYELYLIVDTTNTVREFSEDNNFCVLKVYPAFVKGDINGDGMIDISDVILCLRMAIGLPVIIK
ncbi:MAG: PQQ-binding-like beta-propeller repeat protein, partial [bacterium]|nr:PQQ-binding-like beta-propeller repeat protein [bacterium]